MPTLTLTFETLEPLGVRRAQLVPVFTLEGRGLLEALLASRSFDMSRAVRVVKLTSGEGSSSRSSLTRRPSLSQDAQRPR